jgi:hypothetical protein
VLQLEFLPAGEGDFSAPNARSDERGIFRQGREPIQLEEAQATLGRPPLWLGHEYDGLKLAGIYRQTTSTGHRHRLALTGPLRAAVLNCLSLRRERGDKASMCIRALGVAPLEVGPDGVFTEEGAIQWSEEEPALVLFYGRVGDDPSTYPKGTTPQFDERHLTLTETTQPSRYGPMYSSYIPPAGSVFLRTGGGSALLRIEGIYVTIEGTDDDAIIAAAKHLQAMPGSR